LAFSLHLGIVDRYIDKRLYLHLILFVKIFFAVKRVFVVSFVRLAGLAAGIAQ